MCCLHFKAVVDNVEEMQERDTGMIQGLEKLPPRKRQQQLWVVRELLEVQLDLHTFQDISESRQASVLGRPDGERQQTHALQRGKQQDMGMSDLGTWELLCTQGWPSHFQSPAWPWI